jgi:hypothetical protein
MAESGWRWLFPLCVTLGMSALNTVFGATTACVSSLSLMFPGSSTFLVNLVNFSYYFVFFFIGPLVPAVTCRVKRGKLLLFLILIACVGTALEALYSMGFVWLLVGSFVASLPQPFLVANVANILGEFVPERYEARYFGLYVALTDGAVGVAYLSALWSMPDVEHTQANLRQYIYAALAALSVCLFAAALYWYLEPDDAEHLLAKRPIEVELPPLTRAPRSSALNMAAGLWLFWSYLGLAALADGVGNALGVVFQELSVGAGLSSYELAGLVIAMAAVAFPVPVMVGALFDWARHGRPRIGATLPALYIAGQAVGQIGAFYLANNILAGSGGRWLFMFWMILFAVSNAAIEAAFLPALLYLAPQYSRSKTNALLTWLTTMFAAASSLALLYKASNRDVSQQLAPLFLYTGLFSTITAVLVGATAARHEPHR